MTWHARASGIIKAVAKDIQHLQDVVKKYANWFYNKGIKYVFFAVQMFRACTSLPKAYGLDANMTRKKRTGTSLLQRARPRLRVGREFRSRTCK